MSKNNSNQSLQSFYTYFNEESLQNIIEKGQIPSIINHLGPDIDKIEKVKIALHFFSSLSECDEVDISLFQKASFEVMETLMPDLIGKLPEISKLWSHFFTICEENYLYRWKDQEDWSFLNSLVQIHLSPSLMALKGFWKNELIRIIFRNQLLNTNPDFKKYLYDIIDTIRTQSLIKMQEALEEIERQLCLHLNLGKKNILQLMKTTLNNLIPDFKSFNVTKITPYITHGRFDKDHFQLTNSVVIGEDGGWYILLNKIKHCQLKWLVEGNLVPEQYLYSKIKQQIPDTFCEAGSEWYKIVIGTGSFGKCRLGISLLPSEKARTGDSILSIGDLICVKKSRNITKIVESDIRMAVWNDYASELVGKHIHSPEIYDMVIARSIHKKHCKGYTMQQFMPVDDGMVFLKKNSECQKWSDHKLYFSDIFEVLIDLLERGVCMTDLKPSNTLYDKVNKVGKLIDLAGCVKKRNFLELEKCKRKYIKEYSEGFTSPEILKSIDDPEEIIDLPKSCSYSIGKMMQRIIISEQENIEKFEDKCPNIYVLKELVKQMTLKSSKTRLSAKNAFEIFQKIGPSIEMAVVNFTDFISKMLEIMMEDQIPEIFGLKKDIFLIEETLINNKVTFFNSDLSPNLNPREIFEINDLLTDFLRKKISKESVFLLLGGSGSGKTTAFQLKYLNLFRKTQPNDPIPIYMNLSTSLSVKQHWQNINEIIKKMKPSYEFIPFSNFSGANKYPIILFLDSFDESRQKCNLVIRFLKELGNNPKNKILINCRTDYLQNNKDDEWFRAGPEKEYEFTKLYILALNKFDYGLEAYVKKFLKIHNIQESVNEYMRKIEIFNIKETFTTCYMVYLALSVLPEFDEEQRLSKFLIYQKYIENRIIDEKQKIPPNYIKKIMKEFEVQENKLMSFLEKVARKLAKNLHIIGKPRMDREEGEGFFSRFKYKKENEFNNQSLFNIAKMLDLHFEVKGDVPDEEISLGFAHETIKNYFLVKAIVSEALRGNSLTLSKKLLIEDDTLVGFLAEVVSQNDKVVDIFKEIIFKTKTNKKPTIITAASNAISVLIAANISFFKEDLSNISICNANIRDGVFTGSDFTDADLSNVNLANCKLSETIFQRTNLENIQLGLHPDILMTQPMKVVSFAPNGKYIFGAGEDNFLYIWESNTRKLDQKIKLDRNNILFIHIDKNCKFLVVIWTTDIKFYDLENFEFFEGRTWHNDVSTVTFSKDEEYIAVGTENGNVEYYGNVYKENSFYFIQRFREVSIKPITCLALSPNNKFILAGCQEEVNRLPNCQDNELFHIGYQIEDSLKMWDLYSGRLVKVFNQYKQCPQCSAFSLDSQSFVVGYTDGSMAFMEISRNKCTLLPKHNYQVCCVKFSNDGQYFLSSSMDNTFRLWDKIGKWLRTFQGHLNCVNCVGFSPDDTWIVSCSNDKTIRLWEKSERQSLKNFEGHINNVNCVAFSQNGTIFLSSGCEKSMKLWDLKSGKLIKNYEGGHVDVINSMAISRCENYILSGAEDNVMILWQKSTGKILRSFGGHEKTIYSVVFSFDATQVLSSGDNKVINMWDSATGKLIIKFTGHHAFINQIDFYEEDLLMSCSGDTQIRFWDIKTGDCVSKLKGHLVMINSMAFNKKNNLLVSCDEFFIRLWNVKEGKNFLSIRETQPLKLAFATDGKNFFCFFRERTLKIFDLNGNVIKIFEGAITGMTCFAFFKGIGISGTLDGSIKLWKKTDEKNWSFSVKMVISARETGLFCKDLMMKDVRNLSKDNELVILQRVNIKVEYCNYFSLFPEGMLRIMDFTINNK